MSIINSYSSKLTRSSAHVLEELLRNPQAIHGLIQLQSPQTDSIHAQQLQASHQLHSQRAPQLQNRILHDLPQLRETAGAALANAQQAEAEWRQLEADMYKALQPFSLRALQLRMDSAVTEAEQVCDSLASSFLDEAGAYATDGDDSVASFIKQYRKERKTYHMRKETQERWKEERVGRAY